MLLVYYDIVIIQIIVVPKRQEKNVGLYLVQLSTVFIHFPSVYRYTWS